MLDNENLEAFFKLGRRLKTLGTRLLLKKAAWYYQFQIFCADENAQVESGLKTLITRYLTPQLNTILQNKTAPKTGTLARPLKKYDPPLTSKKYDRPTSSSFPLVKFNTQRYKLFTRKSRDATIVSFPFAVSGLPDGAFVVFEKFVEIKQEKGNIFLFLNHYVYRLKNIVSKLHDLCFQFLTSLQALLDLYIS